MIASTNRLTIRKRARGLALAASLFVVVSGAVAQSGSGVPMVTGYTLISGTPDMFQPGAAFANFEAGDLVVGSTHWDNDGDGVVFLGSFQGFVWSPAEGAKVIQEDPDLYWTEHFQTPSSIANNKTVVGTVVNRQNFRSRPYVWLPSTGLVFMPCTVKGGDICMGSPNAISSNGGVAVGMVSSNVVPGQPTRAAKWTIAWKGRLRIDLDELATADTWSNAWDVSADGTVIVGDSGPEELLPAAARWTKGKRQPMEAVGNTSSALFTAKDGSAAVGWAEVDGRKSLVRWDRYGAALVAEPPDGATIELIRAVSPAATAAVGALSRDGNWAPFLWTLHGGFTVIPENGMEKDYDASEAFDVSDDGTSVVGYLGATVVSNGYPPIRGFLWRPSTGLVLMNDLMSAAGFENPDFYFVDAISGDGLRLLITGNVGQTVHDTNSLIVTLAYP